MTEEVVAEDEPYGEQAKRDDHIAHATSCNEEHDHEEDEEEQGTAQVTLEDHEQQADAPHDEQREQHAKARQAEGSEVDGRGRERLSVAREVEREEEDDEYLGELTGLEGERPDEDPQLGSVDLRADEHRKKQESDADDAERVLVVREVVEVAHEEERGDHGDHREEQPNDLAVCLAWRESRHKGDADAREHEHDGQDGGVGTGRESPDGDMCHREGHEESDGHGKRGETQGDVVVHHIHRVEQNDRDSTQAQEE